MHRIAIATALDATDTQAFSAALRFTREAGASLSVLHVHDEDHPADWRKLPTVRALLERWGMLPADASVEDFEKLGIRVLPLDRSTKGDHVQELVVRVAEAQPDLLVLGTGGRMGLQRVLQPSVSEPVSREWGGPTLVVSQKGRPLVGERGEVVLRRVLVPIDTSLPQQSVIDTLVRFLEGLGAASLSIILFHVGSFDGIPTFELPPRTDWMWRTETAKGSVVDGILKAAALHDVDLIAMGTHGHDTWLDALRGSNTERVLRRTPCPVLIVPVP